MSLRSLIFVADLACKVVKIETWEWKRQKTKGVQKCDSGLRWVNNLTLFTGKHMCLRLQHACFPVNIAKLLKTPILKNIYERLLLLPKVWLYCFLPLYSFTLTKHSHVSIFTTLHAKSATKIKERSDISYNSNVTIIWKCRKR